MTRVTRTLARVNQLSAGSYNLIADVWVKCPNILGQIGADDRDVIRIFVQIATQSEIAMQDLKMLFGLGCMRRRERHLRRSLLPSY